MTSAEYFALRLSKSVDFDKEYIAYNCIQRCNQCVRACMHAVKNKEN